MLKGLSITGLAVRGSVAHGQKTPILAAIENNNERAVALALNNYKEFCRMPCFDT